jgi:hypothetical protein
MQQSKGFVSENGNNCSNVKAVTNVPDEESGVFS